MRSRTQPFLIAAACLVAGAGLGWLAHGEMRGEPEPAASRVGLAPGPDGPMLDAPPPAPSLETSEDWKRIARLESEVRDLRSRNAALAAQVERHERAAVPAPPLDPQALRFGITGASPVFDGADWTALAGHVAEMAKIMPRLRDDLTAGRDLGPDLTQGLQEHNTPLATFAVAASQELKGTGPNGAYTHPAVIANLIRAGLIAANDPLTPAQEQAIVALGNAWVADAERAVAAVPDGAPALARTIVEVDAKQRFLDAVKAQLTEAQRAILFHPETEGRLGLDLLSPALVYMLHTGVYGSTPGELAAKLVDTLLKTAGAKDVDAAALLYVGERWLADVPSASEPRAMRDGDNMFPTAAAMQAHARAQVAAVTSVAQSGRLAAEQVSRLLRGTTLLTPQVLRAE